MNIFREFVHAVSSSSSSSYTYVEEPADPKAKQQLLVYTYVEFPANFFVYIFEVILKYFFNNAQLKRGLKLEEIVPHLHGFFL